MATALLGRFDEAYLDIPEEVGHNTNAGASRYFGPGQGRETAESVHYCAHAMILFLDIVRTGNESFKSPLGRCPFSGRSLKNSACEVLPKQEKIVFKESGYFSAISCPHSKEVDYLGRN
jgi:hypothetical protein